MSKKGEPRPPVWSEFEKARLRRYADRGFSAVEAGRCMGRSNRAIEQMAGKLGIHFHGPCGAPLLNQNRRKGMLSREDRA